MIPYGKHEVTQSDIDELVGVLKNDPLTQGKQVPLFEDEIREYVGADFAVATSSATAALHLTLLSMGVKKGDFVWTSGISFVASANCALYCGAKIDFVDINLNTINLCVDALTNKLKIAANNNKIPKVLVVVHMAGQSCDMEKISKICQYYNVEIVEDASHATGAKYKEYLVGSCKYSAATIFSFHPVKIITAGEGGVILTNRSDIFEKTQRLRTHGIIKSKEHFEDQSNGEWYYEQIDLGFNYRMSDIHATLVRSQLKRLDKYLNAREKIAKKYEKYINWKIYDKTLRQNHNISANHLFVIRTNPKIGKSNSKIFSELRMAGIGVQKHYIPIYKHPFFKKLSNVTLDLTNCENYYNNCISIPIYPTLSEQKQLYVIETLNNL
ncbi:UDP-4-amino-4,6-dideoxy-N-acetyl-beta-L-altrosamine transaminase [Alphaproteobacteria bacterium]|nr:UDP-4-amino-4,6-dideoxy-N-acetyl-beta-L-altrosamine transaminase [Alphaproteobacteria bacterium]